jgi:hypothetical protein
MCSAGKRLLIAALLSTLPFAPADAESADFCHDLAVRAQQNSSFQSGKRDLFSTLTEGKRPWLRLASEPSDNVRLRPGLTETNSRVYDSKITALPEVGLLAQSDRDPLAECQYITLFSTTGRQSKIEIPDRATSQIADSAFCGRDEGFLARAGRSAAIVGVLRRETDHDEIVRITPLDRFHQWGRTCDIEAQFAPVFKQRIFTSLIAPLAGSKLEALGDEIARNLWDRGRNPESKQTLDTLDPNVRPEADKMIAALKENGESLIPHFDSADAKEDRFFIFRDSFHAIIVDNHLYAMIAGNRQGRRSHAFPDMGWTLLDWRDGKLIPIASAEIEVARGPLTSLTVRPN